MNVRKELKFKCLGHQRVRLMVGYHQFVNDMFLLFALEEHYTVLSMKQTQGFRSLSQAGYLLCQKVFIVLSSSKPFLLIEIGSPKEEGCDSYSYPKRLSLSNESSLPTHSGPIFGGKPTKNWSTTQHLLSIKKEITKWFSFPF